MRYALVCCLLLAGSALAIAEDVKPEERVFVEWQLHDDVVYVGEDVWFAVRVGFDGPYFEKHGVQLFREKLDLPLQLTAPWPGTPVDRPHALESPLKPRGRMWSFVRDGELATGLSRSDERRNGRNYVAMISGRYRRFEEPGRVRVQPPTARFAFAERFEEDFMEERVAIEPRFFTVAGEPLTIEVRALPEDGRPASFTGAIGSYKLVTSIDQAEIALAEVVTLTVAIRGVGNLARVPAPKLGELPNWHVRGVRDGEFVDVPVVERSFLYELAPRRPGVLAIPPIEIAYFHSGDDPGYRVLRTDGLKVVVHGEPGRDTAVSPHQTKAPDPPEDKPLWPYGVFGAIAGAVVVLALGRRRRALATKAVPVEAPRDEERIAAAAAALGERADDRTLAAYLAAHLDCSTPAVIGPDLAARLAAAGVPPSLATRTAEALTDLVAARYGGAPASIDAGLLAELQSALTT